jgi:hypothetical protein
MSQPPEYRLFAHRWTEIERKWGLSWGCEPQRVVDGAL